MKIEFIAQLALLFLVVITQIRLRRQQKTIVELRNTISNLTYRLNKLATENNHLKTKLKKAKNKNRPLGFFDMFFNPFSKIAKNTKSFRVENIPLEQQLKDAIANEDFELAEKIQKKINKRTGND